MIRKSNFVLRGVAGEFVLVPLKNQLVNLNSILTFNESAAYLWELLENDCTVNELVSFLSNKYHIASSDAKNDVEFFIKQMKKLDLIDM